MSRSLGIALALAGGCVFIGPTEHEARLAQALGDSADSGEGAAEELEGSFSLEIEAREEVLSCADALALTLAAPDEAGDRALSGAGSCSSVASADARLDGLLFELTLSGALAERGEITGIATLTVDGAEDEVELTGARDPASGRLSGAFTAEVQLQGEGKVDVVGSWEAASADGP